MRLFIQHARNTEKKVLTETFSQNKTGLIRTYGMESEYQETLKLTLFIQL